MYQQHLKFKSSRASGIARSLIFSLTLLLMFSLTLSANMGQAITETHGYAASPKSKIASQKKKKKTKKRMRADTGSSRRTEASTSRRARFLAQNDLESDLESELESELDNDLESDLGSDLSNDLNNESGVAQESAQSAADSPVNVTRSEPAIQAAAGDDVQIQDIQYDSKKAGGTVVISTTGAATYRTREIPAQNQVVVEIANAKLPERLKRPFNTKDFKQSIISLNAYQDAGSNTARVVLQFRQPRSVDVRQNGTTLTVVALSAAAAAQASVTANSAVGQPSQSDDFGDEETPESLASNDSEEFSSDLSGVDSQVDGASSATTSVTSSSMSSATTGDSTANNSGRARVGTTNGKILPSSTLDEERLGEVRFFGKPISIEVRDTPVRDVITLISDQSGANIIIADDVQGSITIKLRQVPWDQALSIIMKTRSLGYVRQGGVLRIAPVRQLQAEVEEARRIIEAQEATLPLRVKVIPVSFASVTLLTTQIRSTLQATSSTGAPNAPGAAVAQTGRGRIEADPRSSSLIVTDTDENIKRIEQLVKALDTAPLQVMIEGKIVEAKEEAGRRLGINWGYQGQDLGFAGGTLSHNAQIAPTIGAANTTLDLKLGTLDFLGDLNAKLSLFENEAVAKIISSPRVVTMNNQAATITQSVQIPIPTTTTVAGSAPATSIAYRAIPTTLNVTPQITSGGDVLMQIAFTREFQSGETSGSTVAIESRDIRTNVMVKNGQTTVIGGIYQADQNESEQGTPFLRKVPVLGWLFKSTSKSSVRNELLVFITPRILNAERTLPKAGSVQ